MRAMAWVCFLEGSSRQGRHNIRSKCDLTDVERRHLDMPMVMVEYGKMHIITFVLELLKMFHILTDFSIVNDSNVI